MQPKNYIRYPEKIYLVPATQVNQGNIATISALKSFTDVYTISASSDERLVINDNQSGFTQRETREQGVSVPVVQVNNQRDVNFVVSTSFWEFAIEAIQRGMLSTDVETDQTASIDAADDATAMKGVKQINRLLPAEYSLLAEMPADLGGDRQYIYAPKLVKSAEDRERNLSASNEDGQQQSITLNALALQPENVAAHQALFGSLTDDSLYIEVEGQADGV